jgi:hypothetical protein
MVSNEIIIIDDIKDKNDKIKKNKSTKNKSQKYNKNIFITKEKVLNEEEKNISNSDKNNELNISSSSLSKKQINDNLKNKVWKHIFIEINYKGDKEIIITAEQIKKSKKTWKGENNQFEPRLLCKQDSDKDRPDIFREYGIYIISVKNGEYLLSKNSIYYKLVYSKPKIIELKINDDSLLLSIGNSESSLIDNLRYTGVFESKKYLGERILYGPLLNGRHRCSFVTKIGDNSVEICGSQYETDACYESKNKILLIECKNLITDSMNIRQLYYPYRTIYDKINNKKEIITLFISKDKQNIIHIWKFEFSNPLEMTSIKNVGYHRYQFD